MKPTTRLAAVLCICILLVTVVLSTSGCRNRAFSPAMPPNPSGREKYPADFQCWVVENGQATACLTGADTAEIFEAVQKIYEKSDTGERFTPSTECLMLVFCTGGTAPETTIPAYQLPNAQHYGVYTLYPDDRGSYSDVLLTANVRFFALKEGSYEQIRSMLP